MGSWKLETDIGAAGLPQFLRDLAQALESGVLESGSLASGVPLRGELAGLPGPGAVGGLRKLVLVASAEGPGDRFALKLKAKRGHEVRVPAKAAAVEKRPAAAKPPGAPKIANDPKAADAFARAREKYRQLKKAMQADYKALRKAAEAGVMPAQDIVESFLALGESMAEMAQPLKSASGPEAVELKRANSAYLEDARALRRAVSARDVASLVEVLARLERRKSACHAQFR